MITVLNKLEIYTSCDGKKPFIDWLEGLKDKKARYIIKERLDRFALGKIGDYKVIDKRIIELRIHYAGGYRLYCGVENKNKYILLAGGIKRTQKKDIVKGKKYWCDYLER